MEGLSERFTNQGGGLYNYDQLGGDNHKKKGTEKECKNFKELYLKTKKELENTKKKLEKLEKLEKESNK